MALTIIKGPRKIRDFLTYDLEWIPGTLEIRLAGVYDGERYSCYDSIDTFINRELTSKNRGRWFYAHAGGLADFQFVLEKLSEREGWEVKCAFSGSAAIICVVRRGKNAWHFVDSYWLLRDKLENIAKWIGLKKGEEANFSEMTEEEKQEFFASVPLPELIAYNEQDCVILWKAIQEMQLTLLDLGGQLQKTLASSAMHLFRREFLLKDIPTNWGVNVKGQEAYFASRVEVLNSESWESEYYDINSSFPYAMTKACPGEYIGSSRNIPDYGLYMGDVTIEVPECYLPPIPIRFKGRLFFPCGIWRSWLSSVDIELLQRKGGKILKIHEVLEFEPFHDLKNYAQTLYGMRKKAESPFERTAFKLLLNSLYGKFAEGEEKRSMLVNPSKIERDKWEMLFPGAWIREMTVPIPHRHVPVSMHITARARMTLFDFMGESVEAGEDVHYCDTDGFSTTHRYETTNDLGGLKLEKRLIHADWVASKVYYQKGRELQKDGSWTELGDAGVKAKGFSRMNTVKMEMLMEGRPIKYGRMKRIKEVAKNGSFKPEETIVSKRLQKAVLTKRFHYPDGHTRPWQIDELREYFQGNRRF